jgi:hypothetical protein
VKLPSILFFQVEGQIISDYFLIELFEETIEKSFIELKDYILMVGGVFILKWF